MVHLALLFAPARMEDWPAVVTDNADWMLDVASLVEPKHAGMVMEMGSTPHDHR
jgi:hypothetical protein